MTDSSINLADWCAGDGTDQTEQLNSAAQAAMSAKQALFMPESLTIRVDGVANLRGLENIDLQGTITVGAAGRIEVGNDAQRRVGAHIRIRRVAYADSAQTNVALRTIGLKQAHIWVDYCDRWEWYADGSIKSDDSCSYCTAYPGLIRRLDFTCLNDETNTNRGWITQINFISGDIKRIETFSAGYRMNQITFIGTCLESGEVHLDNAARWRFMEVRCEYGTKFWFGASTSRIVVEDAFISNEISVQQGAILMEDLGVENVITTSFEQQYQRRTLLAIDTDTRIYDGCAEIDVAVQPGVNNLHASSTFSTVLDTGMIQLRGEAPRAGYESATRWKLSRIMVSADTAAFRPQWYFYDAAQNLVSDSSGVVIESSATWDATQKRFSYSVNVAASTVTIKPSSPIRYARLVVTSGSPLTPFTRMEVTGFFLGGSSDYLTNLLQRRLRKPLSQISAPTKGAPPVGERIRTPQGDLVVEERAKRTLSAANTGAKQVTANTGDKLAVGDVIGIELSTGKTHWTKIAGLTASNIQLADALPSEIYEGSPAINVRWR